MENHSPKRQEQIAIHVTATSFSVEPGGSVTIPVLLHNQGAVEGLEQLAINLLIST